MELGVGLAAEALVLVGRQGGGEGRPGLSAAAPGLVELAVEPGYGAFAGRRVVAVDEVVARVRDVVAFVVPDEGVVAGGGVGDRREALGGRAQGVGEGHQMRVVERQRDVADDPVLAQHRGRPPDQPLEALADRVLQAGIAGVLRGEGLAEGLRARGGVVADPVRAHLGADHARDVDLAGAQGLQCGPVGLRAHEGVLAPGDVAQTCVEEQAAGVAEHLDALAAVEVDEAHLEEERARGAAHVGVGCAVMEAVGVVRQRGAHQGELAGLRIALDPALALGVERIGSVLLDVAHAGVHEAAIARLVRGQAGSQPDVAVAFAEELRDAARGGGGERLDGLARAVVEGIDGVVDRGLAGAHLRVAHHVGHADRAQRDELAEVARRAPGEHREQHQRYDLDRDEDRDQLCAQAHAADRARGFHRAGARQPDRSAGVASAAAYRDQRLDVAVKLVEGDGLAIHRDVLGQAA